MIHGLLAGGLAWAVRAALAPVPVEPSPVLPPLVFALPPASPPEREILPPAEEEAVPPVAVASDAVAESPSVPVAEEPAPVLTVTPAVTEADPVPVLHPASPASALARRVCALPRRPGAAAAGTAPIPAGAVAASAPAASAEAPVRARVQVVERVGPVYPRQARRLGLEGIVRLDVTVDERGEVIAVAVASTSGHPVLDEAAEAAVRHWHFTPAAGSAEQVRIIIRFELT